MNEGRISVSYAKALLSWATDHNCAPEVYEQSQILLRFIEQNPEFYDILTTPMASLSLKIDSIGRILSKETPLLIKIVGLMVRNHREKSLKNTLLSFQEGYRKKFGIAKAMVESAVELNDYTCSSIDSFLEKTLGKRIEMEFNVNPSLIGGVLLIINDHLLDKSVKRELELFRKQLVGKGI